MTQVDSHVDSAKTGSMEINDLTLQDENVGDPAFSNYTQLHTLTWWLSKHNLFNILLVCDSVALKNEK